jgi:hypothetical protein
VDTIIERTGPDPRRPLAQLLNRSQQAVGDKAERDQRGNDEKQPDARHRRHRPQQRDPQRSERRQHAVDDASRPDIRSLGGSEISRLIDEIFLRRSIRAGGMEKSCSRDICIDELVAEPDEWMGDLPALQ